MNYYFFQVNLIESITVDSISALLWAKGFAKQKFALIQWRAEGGRRTGRGPRASKAGEASKE